MKKLLWLMLPLFLGACASGVSIPGFSSSRETQVSVRPCLETEQRGCFEIDVVMVEYSPKVEELVHLLQSSESESEQSPGESWKVAKQVYEKVKRGEVKLYEKCISLSLYAWGVDRRVPDSAMAVYVLPGGAGNGLERLDAASIRSPGLRAPVAPKGWGLGPLAAAYEERKVCGGKWAFQFPLAFLTAESYMVLCPALKDERAVLLYPAQVDNQGAGVHLSQELWQYVLEKRWPYGVLVIMVDTSPPATEPTPKRQPISVHRLS